MAPQPTAKELQTLKDKKFALTLDEYYEQYVKTEFDANSNGSNRTQERFNTEMMKLTLDEYYEHFVLPKQRAQCQEERNQLRSSHYHRTHYFAPSYLERRQPRQPGATIQRR